MEEDNSHKMEGLVWALTSSSGTDPDLESEVQWQAEITREEIRQRELELRYLVKVGEEGEEEVEERRRDQALLGVLEEEEERRMNETPVIDHYSARWPEGERSPKPLEMQPIHNTHDRPRSPSTERTSFSHRIKAAKSREEVAEKVTSVSRTVLPKLPENWVAPYLIAFDEATNQKERKAFKFPPCQNVRPSKFEICSAPGKYKPHPGLKMAYPRHPRIALPMCPAKKEAKMLPPGQRRQQLLDVHRTCCKPPTHPINGLVVFSGQVLKRHYDSFSRLCYLKTYQDK